MAGKSLDASERLLFDTPFELQISETEKATFSDLRSVIDWLQQQITALTRISVGIPLNAKSETLEELTKEIFALRGAAEQIFQNPEGLDRHISLLLRRLHEIYDLEECAVPVSGSIWFQEIEDAQDEKRWVNYRERMEPVLKKYAGSLIQRQLEKDSKTTAPQASSENESSEFQRLLTRFNRFEQEHASMQHVVEELQESRSDFDANAKRQLERLQGEISAQFESKILRASTSFWDDKRKKHFWRSISFLLAVSLWLIACYWVLEPALESYRDHVLNADSVFDLIPYLPSNILLIGVAIWGLRILVRQMLSENHLRTRAEERIVLIKTYVALTNERTAEAEDRKIILNAIFATSQDGVIQEDLMPQIGAIKIN